MEYTVGCIPDSKIGESATTEGKFEIFDFNISPEDMQLLKTFNENYRVVEDPMVFY